MKEKKTTAKKPTVKKQQVKEEVKKPVKVELNERLLEIAEYIEKVIKEQRGKQLNTSACARLGRVKADLRFISRNIIK